MTKLELTTTIVVLPVTLGIVGVQMTTEPIVKPDATEPIVKLDATEPIARQDAKTTVMFADERGREPIGEIHTIAGGFAAGGASSSRRQAYAKGLPSEGHNVFFER